MTIKKAPKLLLAQVGLLAVIFWMALSSSARKSPTMDEQGFLIRGVGYVTGTNRHMRVGHPAGLNILNGALVARDPTLKLPTDHPSWQETSFHRPGELFLWEIGNDVERLMTLGRLPTIWLALLLAALCSRWAGEMSGSRWTGAAGLALIALDPNILAHSRLITTDLGLAAGATVAGYSLWRYLKQPGWERAFVAGIGFALLQNTKFTAGLFVPLFTVPILLALIKRWRMENQFPKQMMAQLALGYPLAAFLALWGMYGFNIGTLPATIPTLPQLGGSTLPLAHHLEQLLDIGGRVQVETPSFLMGENGFGWRSYFPIAFLLKTPLPTLALLLLAGAYRIKQGADRSAKWGIDDAMLLIPAGGYFIIAIFSDINLGYRHLLPILPFLAIFSAKTLFKQPGNIGQGLPWAFIAWLGLSAVAIYPHFIPYFNPVAGGADGGWRYLVDSNVDWGQDLAGLAEWQRQNGGEQIWLSYFGEARPDYYQIDFQGLPSFPPRLINPAADPFYPRQPAPGVYAISASNLQGVLFNNHDLMAFFREQEPFAKIGYSIFLYRVEPFGQKANLYLGGVALPDIDGSDYAQLNGNDVSISWFDPNQALLLPASPDYPVFYALDSTIAESLSTSYVTLSEISRNDQYRWLSAKVNIDLTEPLSIDMLFLAESHIHFMGVANLPKSISAGNMLQFDLTLRNLSPPAPVKIFAHLVNANGEIAAQWDGIGAQWEGWRQGDLLIQKVAIPLPASLPAGSYQLLFGLTRPDTGTRYQTNNGHEHYPLGEIEIR